MRDGVKDRNRLTHQRQPAEPGVRARNDRAQAARMMCQAAASRRDRRPIQHLPYPRSGEPRDAQKDNDIATGKAEQEIDPTATVRAERRNRQRPRRGQEEKNDGDQQCPPPPTIGARYRPQHRIRPHGTLASDLHRSIVPNLHERGRPRAPTRLSGPRDITH